MAPVKFMISESLTKGVKIPKVKLTVINPMLKISLCLSVMGLGEKAENNLFLDTSIKQGNTVTRLSKYIIATIKGCHESLGKQSMIVCALSEHPDLSKLNHIYFILPIVHKFRGRHKSLHQDHNIHISFYYYYLDFCSFLIWGQLQYEL